MYLTFTGVAIIWLLFIHEMTKSKIMTHNLPPIEIYRKYIQTASEKFNISIQECRDRYGLYTNEQWDNLFKQ